MNDGPTKKIFVVKSIMLFFFTFSIHAKMHEYNIKDFQYHYNPNFPQRLPLEHKVYQILKQNPLNQKINYLAVPWTVLIIKGNRKEFIKLIKKIRRLKLRGGFTVCGFRGYQHILPILNRIGIDTLFTPHALTNEKYKNVSVFPLPHIALNGACPAATKDIWYSFIGADTHPVRRALFDMPHPHETVIIERKQYFYSPHENSEQEIKGISGCAFSITIFALSSRYGSKHLTILGIITSRSHTHSYFRWHDTS